MSIKISREAKTRMIRKTACALIFIMALLPIFSGMAAAGDSDRVSREFKERGLRCGTRIVYEDEARAVEAAHERWLRNYGFQVNANAVPTIRVFFHVLRKDTTIAGGDIPIEWINAQMNELEFYFPNYNFVLQPVNRVTNAQWFEGRSGSKMKSSLHQGTCADLNFYTNKVGQGLLGYATFPSDCRGKSIGNDGVVVHYQTLPGGPYEPYNEGDTGTHEVGHWLGLYHTFQGGCTGNGDFVSDTAAEASPNYDCIQVGERDTCSGGGPDPVDNIMDYTEDACMDNLTSGQAARWTSLSCQYRGLCG